MKVKCIINKANPKIHGKWLVEWVNTLEQLELTVGKIYTVLAIAKYRGKLYCYVMGDESDNYPLAFPIEFFVIYDNRVSKHWDSDLTSLRDFKEINLKDHEVCSFAQWKIQKDLFYEKILEEDKQTISIFNEYKDKMEAE